mmetsp:Transcript_25050/g.50862  ORF Transcript_25050/g.50862 Transcript_25050/m.50862 type:complete len:218 (+) Transcript_25050:56-709(+)
MTTTLTNLKQMRPRRRWMTRWVRSDQSHWQPTEDQASSRSRWFSRPGSERASGVHSSWCLVTAAAAGNVDGRAPSPLSWLPDLFANRSLLLPPPPSAVPPCCAGAASSASLFVMTARSCPQDPTKCRKYATPAPPARATSPRSARGFRSSHSASSHPSTITSPVIIIQLEVEFAALLSIAHFSSGWIFSSNPSVSARFRSASMNVGGVSPMGHSPSA